MLWVQLGPLIRGATWGFTGDLETALAEECGGHLLMLAARDFGRLSTADMPVSCLEKEQRVVSLDHLRAGNRK